MLNLKEDTGEFVNAILEEQSSAMANPFALKVVSANEARTKDLFYTISATSVTKVSFYFKSAAQCFRNH